MGLVKEDAKNWNVGRMKADLATVLGPIRMGEQPDT